MNFAKLEYQQRKEKGLVPSSKPSKPITISMDKAYELVAKFKALEGFSDLTNEMESYLQSQDVVLKKKIYNSDGDLTGEVKYFANGDEKFQKKYPMSEFTRISYEKLLHLEKEGCLSADNKERLDFIREWCV